MHPELRIELPDEARAESLRRLLQPFEVETVPVDGYVELRIALLDRNPEGRVVDALNAVDTWLLTAGLASVRVHLDESTYTVHAPPGAAVS
jgi:hypothetical protein